MRCCCRLPLHLQLPLCVPLHLHLGATLPSFSSSGGGPPAPPEALVLQSFALWQRIVCGLLLPDGAIARVFF
jgi:hypothetical protein